MTLRRIRTFAILVFFCAAGTASRTAAIGPDDTTVVKATLANGMRIVVVRSTLAPVVSTEMTYLVGSRDDPASVPGMAHAQEHMMFRGTRDVSTSVLGTIATALGGQFNAGTTQTLTQYEFTVPASNLDAVMRIESDRMRGALDLQSEWQNERGAIEQEVLRDETQPGADFFRKVEEIAFAGTPYEHEGVGTRTAFDRLTGPEIKNFYDKWYAPNNAVLVIAGDVDPAQAIADARSRFEAIPRRDVPAHQAAHLEPLRRRVMQEPTALAYPLAVVAFRMPGVNSADFLPAFVLQEILGSDRSPIHALQDSGLAISAGWQSEGYVPETQLGYAIAALPPGFSALSMTRRLESIMRTYEQSGVPRELFETTKRQAIAQQELSRNSISALASDWATTIALDDEPSIAREQQLIADVSLADVNRVAKRYLNLDHAIIGALTPAANATQNAPPAPAQTGTERPLAAKPAVTDLPDWATNLVHNVTLPPSTASPVRTTLPNGITLIVQPEKISDSVFLFGNTRTNPALEEPPEKDGVSTVLDALYDEGTKTMDRAAFGRAQDEIDSQISGGSRFALQTTSSTFERAVALLAQDELQPRFLAPAFANAQRRSAENVATALNTVGTAATRSMDEKLVPAGDPTLREPSVAGIRDLTLDDVTSYYRKTIRPDLTTIVVVGNVSPETARAVIERAFGGWHSAGTPPKIELPPIPLNASANVRLTVPELGQDAVTLSQIIPLSRTAPQYAALQLGNAILGGGSLGPEQSRLFRDIRQEAGLVYSITSQLSTGGARSRFVIDYACLPANEARISALVDSEIARLQTQPVGSFELDLMKASIVRHTLVDEGSLGSIGGTLLDDAGAHLPLDQPRLDAQAVMRTDAGAVQSAFAANIHPSNFVHVLVGP